MSRSYGQYCPLALAAEVIGERWSLLVLSRLLDGCSRFNDIQRGLPRITASTLSARLKALEEAEVAERIVDGREVHYRVTEAGAALAPIVDQLTTWGQRWARDMTFDDLDPRFLAWSMHLRIDRAALPPGRTVIEFEFSGAPADGRFFWLVCEPAAVDMCMKHPGFDADLRVCADLRRFIETWRGFRDLQREIAAGRIRVEGPAPLRRALPRWLMLSQAATVERRRGGAERDLQQARSGMA